LAKVPVCCYISPKKAVLLDSWTGREDSFTEHVYCVIKINKLLR